LARKVPLPVSVIMLAQEEAAQADACPPGSVVVTGGGPDRWMMSHRYRWLAEPALAPAGTSTAAAQVIAAASPTGMNRAAFILRAPFCDGLVPPSAIGVAAPQKSRP